MAPPHTAAEQERGAFELEVLQWVGAVAKGSEGYQAGCWRSPSVTFFKPNKIADSRAVTPIATRTVMREPRTYLSHTCMTE